MDAEDRSEALTIQRLDKARHDRASFSCGEDSLDRYLKEEANQHMKSGVSTTHVLSAGRRIVAYITLATAELSLEDVSVEDRRKLPRYPIPAVRMARLAVNKADQGAGHGDLMVAFAVARALDVRETMGAKALIVDALSENAVRFYEAYGFRRTAPDSFVLYLLI